jgi:membrane protein implicated in regulation of membrane protease activity
LAAFGFEALKRIIGTRPKKSDSGTLIQMSLYALAIASLAIWCGGEILPQLMGLVLGFMAFCLWIRVKVCAHTAQWFFIASLSLSLLWTGWNTCTSRLGPADNLNYATRTDVPQKLKEKTGLARVFIGDKIPYPVQSEKRTIQLDLPPSS